MDRDSSWPVTLRGQGADALVTALELAAGGVFVLDDGVIQATDAEFASLVGADPNELPGTAAADILAPARDSLPEEATATDWLETALSRKTDDLPVQVQGGDGSTTRLRVSSRQVNDRWVCLCEADRSTASFDQRTLDAIGDPVYVLGEDGIIEQANEALLSVTGYDSCEIIGRNIAEIVPGGEYERLTDRLDELAQEGQQERFETELLTTAGEVVVVSTTLTVRTAPDGSHAGTIGVLWDIREYKRRQRNLELLKQVLTRVFRHNVRNDLNVIQGHSEILADAVGAELQVHTDQITEAADQLLSHSEKARRIEEVIEADQRDEIGLVRTVETAIDAVTADHPAANIEADLPASTRIHAHHNVSHAIEELLRNAVEHASNGAPQIDVWIDEGSEATTLFVEDESGGLDDSEIEVLRSGDETVLEHASGVGLWLVRWLVELSDADLLVHPTDSGTVMGIRFRPVVGGPVDLSYSPLDSPFVHAPAEIRETTAEQFRGDTVVGRVEARRNLKEIYEALPRTGGHSVVITGEAGIGKTTIVEQFCEELAEDDSGPLVVTGYCEPEIQSPYRPFKRVIERLPAAASFESIRESVGAFDATNSEEAHQRKQALFTEIAEQFRAAVSTQPVVVIVEDMHWADSTTVDLFEYLVAELGQWSHPILFVCTYRTSDVDGSHPVLDIADEAAGMGRGEVIKLEPLDSTEIASLLESAFGVDRLPKSFVEAVHDHTGGNPLFLSELCPRLVDRLGPVEQPDQLPSTLDGVNVSETLEQAIDHRLSALPARVRPALELGAVLGESFSFDVLRESSEQSVDCLIECVDTMVRRQVWTRSSDELEFSHGVVRDRTLEEIGPKTRRELHERAAKAIETVHSETPEEHAARLAYHYEEVGEFETAFAYHRQAGTRASDTHANEEAIEAYRRALALADEHDVGTVSEVAADLANVYNTIGEMDSASAVIDTGLATASGESEARCRLLDERAYLLKTQSRYDEAIEIAKEQRELAESLGLASLEAESIRTIGEVARNRGDYEQAEAYHQRSLAICKESGDREKEAKSLNGLGLVAWRRGDYEQAEQYHRRGLTIKEEIGDRPGQAKSLHNLGSLASDRGNHEQAQEYHQRSLAICEEIGHRAGQAASLNSLGDIARKRGDYEQAREYYRRSLAICDDIGHRTGQGSLYNSLAVVARDCGDYRQAEQYHRQSFIIHREIGNRTRQAIALVRLAALARRSSREAATSEFLQEAGELLADLDDLTVEIDYEMECAALARVRGEHDRALEHLENARAACERSEDPHKMAHVRLEETRLALAREQTRKAKERLAEADEYLAKVESPLRSGRASLLRGQIAAQADERETAREHWERALDTFEEIGALPDTLRTLECFISFERETGCPEQATEYRERARKHLDDAPDILTRIHRR